MRKLDPATQESRFQYDRWQEKNKIHFIRAAREALLQHADHLVGGHLLVTHAIVVFVQESSNPRVVNLADKFVITGAEVVEIAVMKAACDLMGQSELFQGVLERAPNNPTSLLGMAKTFMVATLREGQAIMGVRVDPVTNEDVEYMKMRNHNPKWEEMLRATTRLKGRTYISPGGHTVVRRSASDTFVY